MLPVKNVELTKVHYLEPTKYHRNVEIPTISREVFENNFNKNVIIRKNIFGHKWVLKINELDNSSTFEKRKSVKFWIYTVVFACISIAVLGGLFFTFDLEKKIHFVTCIHKNILNDSNIVNSSVVNNFNNQSGGREFLITNKSTQMRDLPHKESSKKDFPSRTDTSKMYCVDCTSTQVCLKTEETAKPKCLGIVDTHDPTGCGGICLLDVEFCAILDKKHKVFQCSPLKSLLRCPADSFNCGEQCISRDKVCDGINHCRDMQDERNCDCNLEENFRCTSSNFCLPKSKKCDGVIDCWDRSDEVQCHKGCPPQDFACLNGQCIPKEQFCDGSAECLDSTDEPQGCQV